MGRGIGFLMVVVFGVIAGAALFTDGLWTLRLWAVFATAFIPLAFLIGQNNAGGKIKSLRYAETDVQKMREVLLQNAGFQPESIWSVRGATVAQVQQTMHLIQQRVRALRNTSVAVEPRTRRCSLERPSSVTTISR